MVIIGCKVIEQPSLELIVIATALGVRHGSAVL